jgi:hypothetical protein
MSSAEAISVLVPIIAVCAVALTAYFGFRDRARLRATTRFFPASEHNPIRIVVTLANAGRRPMILRLLGGSDSDGKESSQFLGDPKSGLRLGENERHVVTLEKEDLVSFHQDAEGIFLESLWVEDSLGRRHQLRYAKANIKRVWSNDRKPSGDQLN